MARIPSSAAWLAAKYSRAEGQAFRKKARLGEAERQLAFHRRHAIRYEEELKLLAPALAEAESQVKVFETALRLHERAIEVGGISTIRPPESPHVFQHGGINTAILRLLKGAPEEGRTTDEIVLGLAGNVRPEDSRRLRHRLQVRLHALQRQNKIISSGPKYSPEGRWMLSPTL